MGVVTQRNLSAVTGRALRFCHPHCSSIGTNAIRDEQQLQSKRGVVTTWLETLAEARRRLRPTECRQDNPE
jgi:hypothetical protein